MNVVGTQGAAGTPSVAQPSAGYSQWQHPQQLTSQSRLQQPPPPSKPAFDLDELFGVPSSSSGQTNVSQPPGAVFQPPAGGIPPPPPHPPTGPPPGVSFTSAQQIPSLDHTQPVPLAASGQLEAPYSSTLNTAPPTIPLGPPQMRESGAQGFPGAQFQATNSHPEATNPHFSQLPSQAPHQGLTTQTGFQISTQYLSNPNTSVPNFSHGLSEQQPQVLTRSQFNGIGLTPSPTGSQIAPPTHSHLAQAQHPLPFAPAVQPPVETLADYEQKTRASMQKIEELKATIAALKAKNDAAQSERQRKLAGTSLTGVASAPTNLSSSSPRREETSSPSPTPPASGQNERYTGTEADLKALLKRTFPGAEASVIQDLSANVLEGAMSEKQALDMLQEMAHCSSQVAQISKEEQTRRDEEYARQLQQQFDTGRRGVQFQVPSPAQVSSSAGTMTSYDGVGSVSRLEQEQRDMQLAIKMQNQESAQASALQTRGHHQQADQAVPISRVQIHEYEVRDNVTYYTLEVRSSAGKTWSVSKRYSEFEALHSELSSYGITPPALPPKTWLMKMTNANLNQRRIGLEAWIIEVLRQQRMAPQIEGKIQEFLQVWRSRS